MYGNENNDNASLIQVVTDYWLLTINWKKTNQFSFSFIDADWWWWDNNIKYLLLQFYSSPEPCRFLECLSSDWHLLGWISFQVLNWNNFLPNQVSSHYAVTTAATQDLIDLAFINDFMALHNSAYFYSWKL